MNIDNLRISPFTPSSLDWDHIDTVILDMDGTLLDLNFDDHVWNRLLPKRYGHANDLSEEKAREIIFEQLGAAKGTLLWYCFDYWESKTGINICELEQELSHLIQQRPLVAEFLTFLSSLNAAILLATNAHRRSLEYKLEKTEIGAHFDRIISSHDYGYAKEDQRFWEQFCKDHGCVPERSLLIDDNHNVLEAAANFGIAFLLGIQRPNSQGESLASDDYYCLRSFDELICYPDAIG